MAVAMAVAVLIGVHGMDEGFEFLDLVLLDEGLVHFLLEEEGLLAVENHAVRGQLVVVGP